MADPDPGLLKFHKKIEVSYLLKRESTGQSSKNGRVGRRNENGRKL